MLTFQHKPTWTPSKLTLRLPGNKNLHFLYCKRYLVQLHLEVITNPQSINFLNLPLLPVLLIPQWVIFSPQQSPAELQRRSHWSGAGFKEGKASLRTGAGKSKRLFPLSYSGEWKTVGTWPSAHDGMFLESLGSSTWSCGLGLGFLRVILENIQERRGLELDKG